MVACLILTQPHPRRDRGRNCDSHPQMRDALPGLGRAAAWQVVTDGMLRFLRQMSLNLEREPCIRADSQQRGPWGTEVLIQSADPPQKAGFGKAGFGHTG